ncbi:MAG: hypothetical protein V3U07_09065 [Nitrospirales bacterium]
MGNEQSSKTEKEARQDIIDTIVDHESFCFASDNLDNILNPTPSF